MKTKQWFVSIGWSVAIRSLLLSLGLILATFFYVENYLQDQLQNASRFLGDRDRHQFAQLRKSHVDIQLGFIESLALASESHDVISYNELIETIDTSWKSMTLLNGIDALNIYDRHGTLLKHYGSYQLKPQVNIVESVAADGEPREYIDCIDYCRQIISAPFLVAGNKNLIFIWSTTASSLLETFASVTDTAASLVKFASITDGRPFVSGQTGFQKQEMSAQALDYRQHIALNPNETAVLTAHNNRHLSLHTLPLGGEGPEALHLFWVRDITEITETMKQTLRNSLWVMCAAGLLLFILIVVSLGSLTRRSNRLAKVLPLLTESKFDEAEEKLRKLSRRHLFRDEIDVLYETSTAVTRQLKSLNQQLHNLAYRDSLTHLPNRESLYEALDYQLRQLTRHSTYLGLLFIDVDGFKSVNDSYGHSAGDFILVTLAQRVAASIRQADTLYRLSGDEFVIIVTDINDSNGLAITAQKVAASMDQDFEFEGNTFRVSLSIGGVITNRTEIKVDQLLHKADQAMYASKQAGKGRYSYHGKL